MGLVLRITLRDIVGKGTGTGSSGWTWDMSLVTGLGCFFVAGLRDFPVTGLMCLLETGLGRVLGDNGGRPWTRDSIVSFRTGM